MPRRAEGDAAGSPPRALSGRAGRAAAATSLVAALAVAGRLWSLHVAATGDVAGLFHDGGVYLVTARALADGAGYRAIGTPGAPAAVRYPPAYPIALAAVSRLAPRFPDNLPLLKAIGFTAAAGLVVALPGVLVAAGLPPPVAIASAVVVAVAPLTMRYATAIASELPFAALALIALWLVGRPRCAALAGAVAGLAFLTRTVGVTVIAAGLLALRRDRRSALAFATAAVPSALGWLAWLLVHRDAGGTPGYAAALAHDGIPGPGELLAHLAALPAAVGLVTIPGAAEVLPANAPSGLALAVCAVGIVALLAALRGRYGPYVGLTVAVAIAVPWFQPRFLIPLAPLFVASLLTTAWRHAGRAATAALVAVLLCLAAAGNVIALERARATNLPALDSGSWPDGRRSALLSALDWLRTHTGPDDVLASFDDPLVYLYTGRRAVQAYPSLWRPDITDVTTALDGTDARYIVDVAPPSTGAWAPSHATWRTWLAGQRLTLAYEASGVTIWRREP